MWMVKIDFCRRLMDVSAPGAAVELSSRETPRKRILALLGTTFA